MSNTNSIDYHKYINSSEWRAKADAAKQRVGFRCQVCNRPSSEVQLDAHHRTYERLGNELPGDITVLCRDCHTLFSKGPIAVDSVSKSDTQEKITARMVLLYWFAVIVIGFFVWIYLYPAPTPQGAEMDILAYVSYQFDETGVTWALGYGPLFGIAVALVALAVQKMWNVLRPKKQLTPLQPKQATSASPITSTLSNPISPSAQRPDRTPTPEEVEARIYQAMSEVTTADIARFRAKGYEPTLEELYLIAAEDVTFTSYVYPQGIAGALNQWVDMLVEAEQEEFASSHADPALDNRTLALLEQLSKLHDADILSDEEYHNKRTELLKRV